MPSYPLRALVLRKTKLGETDLILTLLAADGRQVREVHAGSSYLSSEDPRVHFGLGAQTAVKELIVRYPDGTVKTTSDVVGVDRIVTIKK